MRMSNGVNTLSTTAETLNYKNKEILEKGESFFDVRKSANCPPSILFAFNHLRRTHVDKITAGTHSPFYMDGTRPSVFTPTS